MPLSGRFSTTLAGNPTTVHYKIYATYKAEARFTALGKEYVFNMLRWEKTKEGTKNPYKSFDRFRDLAYERFGDIVPDDGFGKFVDLEGPENTRVRTFVLTDSQRVSMLKYAIRDVFACVEQIVQKHKHSYLDYAIYHREMDKDDTYEEYIHVVACHCLVHSNFLVSELKFFPVDFAVVERRFDANVWEEIHKDASTAQEDED